MAEYYIAPKSSFDATADAIREKTGSQASIEWTEDGFADAILGPVRTLTNSWDLTSSLTDSVGGLSITLGNGATQTSSGLTLSSASDYATIPLKFSGYKTYEFDIASISKNFSSGHGRLFMANASEGFIWQSSGAWRVYHDSAWSDNFSTSVDALSGKTLRIATVETINQLLNGVTTTKCLCEYWIDGVLWAVPERLQGIQTVNNITIGSSGGSSFCNVTITGVRIYDGVRVS